MANNTFNPYKFDEQRPQLHPNCAACEEMLLDATEGLLSDADQAFFDRHLAGCVSCIESYAEAKRGAAFLSLLKTQRPEPAADLVDRILAHTGQQQETQALEQAHAGLVTAAPQLLPAIPALPANVIPFAPRTPVSRFTRYTRLAMEPRFAMTAAMAFFSIALTLNLTGVRLDQLHASDLNPLNLRRTYYEANAQAIRYYDNLRVVRVLESRVDDIRQAQADSDSDSDSDSEVRFDNSRQTHSAPAKQPEQKPAQKPAPEPHGTSRQDSAPLSTPRLQNTHFEIAPDLLRRSNQAAYAASSNQEGGLA